MSEHEPHSSHSAHGDDHSGGHSKRHGHGSHGSHGGGGHEEGHEGAPEWLISFADNVTLMMGFFVILLAMTMAEVGKGASDGDGEGSGPSASAMEMAIAIREAFHNPVDLSSTEPEDLPLIEYLLAREAAGTGGAFDSGAPGKKPEVQSIRPGDYYAFGGVVSFDPGAATISESGQSTIQAIAKKLRGLRLVLEIRGHSSRAESQGNPTTAMKLSFERAQSVAQTLAANGVLWEQMRIVALGENDPIAEHAYAETQHRVDQRVEIVLTDELMHNPS